MDVLNRIKDNINDFKENAKIKHEKNLKEKEERRKIREAERKERERQEELDRIEREKREKEEYIKKLECDINEIVAVAKKMKVSPELVLLCKIKDYLNKNFSDLHSELKSIDSTIWSNS